MASSLPPSINVTREERASTSGSDKDVGGDESLTSSYLPQDSLIDPDSSQVKAESGRLDRKESYKAQRRNYRKEKKRVEKELLSTFKDESIIVLADWLKVRGSLKSWTKLWCVLKPGLLLLYRSQKAKSSHWIGTIILSTCELIERPSKKDGFCFKLFHPMDQSVWASRGPEGETIGAVVQPLPTSHLIFRAPTNAAGKCWMDALELALRCSSLLKRNLNRQSQVVDGDVNDCCSLEVSRLNDSDVEKHFRTELDDTGSLTDEGGNEDEEASASLRRDGRRRMDFPSEDEEGDEDEDNEEASENNSVIEDPSTTPVQTNYTCDTEEVFGTTENQTEEFSDENKSIVWFLVKQVRPGMDLSRVVLPTFILEPRSFLDKISDYYYHADIISKAVLENEPFMRMKTVVQWYLSGFYKKPKGLKKPYNPILGETFRCYWLHPSGSRTFYLAEQVSHHPPISAFYATNRQEGFTFAGTILAKSKFYGNSTSAILDGIATLSLLPRGEDYVMTMPYAHCKGILMGTMTMELGGKVTIDCEKTGYHTELEFKLRPFLGGGEFTNAVSGRMKLGKETLATIDGHWDDCVMWKDKKSGQEEVLWQVSPEVRAQRLRRYTVPLQEQTEWESARLWLQVSKAIVAEDQVGATAEKTKLEEAQRNALRERKERGEEWETKLFDLEPSVFSGAEGTVPKYTYKHADIRPWDVRNDLIQYERDYVICTKTRHKTPMIRTQSILSVMEVGKSLSQNLAMTERVASTRRRKNRDFETANHRSQDSDTSAPGGIQEAKVRGGGKVTVQQHLQQQQSIQEMLRPLVEEQKNMNQKIAKLNHSIESVLYQHRERQGLHPGLSKELVLVILLVVFLQVILNWFFTERGSK